MRVAHLFFETSMSLAHKSLAEIVKKQTGKKELAAGDTAIFINKRWTAVKLLVGDTILYVRRDKQGINPKAIKYLPTCIEGPVLNYSKALEAAIREEFGEE